MSKLYYISLLSNYISIKLTSKETVPKPKSFTNSKAIRKNTVFKDKKNVSGGFPGGSVVKTLYCQHSGVMGSIPGLGTRSHQPCGMPED